MISIIIPAFNQHEMTAECIAAIRRHTSDYEIILIDNASTPAFALDDVKIIRNEKNLGFPAAINQGLESANGGVVCLLNNDALVTPGWSEDLIELLNKGYSIVGPISNFCAGMQQQRIQTYESTEELDNVANEWRFTHNKIVEVNFIIGFLMLFKRSLYKELGEFDTEFWPCCAEEIDYCFRAREAGYKIAFTDKVYIHHEGSQTFKDMQNAGEINYSDLIMRNNEHLAKRWGGSPWKFQMVGGGG